MGKFGSALATLISQAIVTVYLFYRAQKLYPIPYRFAPTSAMFGVCIALMALGRILQPRTLIAGIAEKSVLLILFIPFVLLFRVVTVAQVRTLKSAVASRLTSPSLSAGVPD